MNSCTCGEWYVAHSYSFYGETGVMYRKKGVGLPVKRNHIEREKLTIRHMVEIYCRGHRHFASGICVNRTSSLLYSYDRIEKCPFNCSQKPACGLCRTNCFTAKRYRQFRQIMRYAGPRMMLYHPYLTMVHIWDAVRGKSRE